MELRPLRTKLNHEHGLEVSGIIEQADTKRGVVVVGDTERRVGAIGVECHGGSVVVQSADTNEAIGMVGEEGIV